MLVLANENNEKKWKNIDERLKSIVVNSNFTVTNQTPAYIVVITSGITITLPSNPIQNYFWTIINVSPNYITISAGGSSYYIKAGEQSTFFWTGSLWRYSGRMFQNRGGLNDVILGSNSMGYGSSIIIGNDCNAQSNCLVIGHNISAVYGGSDNIRGTSYAANNTAFRSSNYFASTYQFHHSNFVQLNYSNIINSTDWTVLNYASNLNSFPQISDQAFTLVAIVRAMNSSIRKYFYLRYFGCYISGNTFLQELERRVQEINNPPLEVDTKFEFDGSYLRWYGKTNGQYYYFVLNACNILGV